MRKVSCSVAEARAGLPGLVKDAERGVAVEITRRGKPVAVLVSSSTYEHLAQRRIGFADACARFRERVDLGKLGLEDGEFDALRDEAPGRRLSV